MNVRTSTIPEDVEHILHHAAPTRTTYNVKVERNTKGFNVEVTVVGARSKKAAITAAKEMMAALSQEFPASTNGNGHNDGAAK